MTPRLVWTSAISAILLVAARDASACGASPPPYWTIASTLPAEGGVIPYDGALIVRAAASPSPGGPIPVSFVVTEEGSADGIMGHSEDWSYDPPSEVWNPLVALKPSTRYQGIVSIQQATLPMGPAGPTGLIWGFSTTAEAVAPITLEGSLVVVVEDYQRDIQECDSNDCGSFNCRVTGQEPAVRAKISLPIVRGGYAVAGYAAWLHYTANSPQTYDGPGEGHPPSNSPIGIPKNLTLHEGEALEVEVPLVEEADPYEPCFALNVWDPTGHAVHAEPKCIGAFKPAAGMKRAAVQSGCHCTMSSETPRGLAAAMGYLGLIALGCARRRLCAYGHGDRRRPASPP